MSLFSDIQQIERDQRVVMATVNHLADEVTAGFKTLEAGQVEQVEGQQTIIEKLETIANATLLIGTGIQALIDKMQALIDIVRGPPGIHIEPGTPAAH